jgi:chromosome segregation ATPase
METSGSRGARTFTRKRDEMIRLQGWRTALVLALGVALVGWVTAIVRQSRWLAVSERQRAANLETIRQLQEALRQRDLEKPPAEAEAPAPAAGNQSGLAQRDAAIQQLNQELTDAHASIKDLQAQIASANDEHQKALASLNASRQKDQADWQSRLDTLKQELDSAQAESEASRQRSAALEAENAKLRSAASEGTARAAEQGRVLADLDDLGRRRDSYLTSIQRRYRDITSQLRGMSGMLASSRDPNASALSGAELTRIQNAISQADDDLRQLSELNARARQLEKKLVKK